MVASLEAVTPVHSASRSREERTIVFTDIVESTHLKQTLGDARALAVFEEHDAAIRDLLREYPGARELGVAGDSFTLAFLNAADALLFSLKLHAALEKLATERGVKLQVRIGLHSGELFVDESLLSGRPIGGMVLDVCARIMSLADGGQTLLSRAAFDDARRALSRPEGSSVGQIEWLSHGLYQLKGADEPMEICEVGLVGAAPLKAPAHAEKARRISTPDGELVLGWRPAVGRDVPGTSWKLERPLGEGGFGEVWLARHTVLKERRVFKFCFRLDRVRSLKREVTLFRVLRDHAGQHPNIVNVHDVYLNEPPFYVAMDFVEGNALPAWAESQGGIDQVPMEARVEIVAQVAEALQAAHLAGVLHRDVKPGNILLSGTARNPKAKLSDFGIGQILSIEALGDVTAHGLTQTLIGSSSGSGTQMYLAPEVVRGQPSSAQSDVYALGVVLYQACIGDFLRPLTTDWEELIEDPVIREDLKRCFAGDPAKRFASAERFAESLRAIPQRRADAEARRAEVAAAERRAFRAGVLRTAFGALAIIALVVTLAVVAWAQTGRARKNEAAAENARGQADAFLAVERKRRAETLFEQARSPVALAYLAAVVRKNPKEESAAERLAYAILQRPLAWPMTPSLPHDSFIEDIGVTPDGKSLLVVTGKSARLWDIEKAEERFPALPIGGQFLSFSQDGKLVVIVGSSNHVIDLATFKVLHELKTPLKNSADGWRYVDVRPQGDAVAILNGSDELTLWDPRTGVQLGEPLRVGAPLTRAAFSPDGNSLVAADTTGQLCLWDYASRQSRWSVKTGDWVGSISWHPASVRVAIGSRDKTVQVRSAETGDLVGRPMQTLGPVPDVDFSPDGSRVCASSWDGGLYICSGETGERVAQTERETFSYRTTHARYTADGSKIVVRTEEGLVKFYDAISLRPALESLEFPAVPHTLRVAKHGPIVAIGGEDGSAQVWNIGARKMTPFRMDHRAPVTKTCFQQRGEHLITAGADGRLFLWDLGRPGAPQELGHLPAGIVDIGATDGAMVAVTDGGSAWWLTREDDGKWKKPMQLTMTPARTARFSRDGSHFLLIRVDGMVQLFETKSARAVSKPVGANVTDAIVGRAGRDLVWIENGTRVQRLDVNSGKITDTPISHKSNITRLQVSPSGEWMASISRDLAAVWSLKEGAAAPKYLPQGNAVETVEFSADDRWAVATSKQRAAHIWRLPEGVRLPESLTSEGKPVILARFLPKDSRRAWTVDSQAVRFWDAPASIPLSDPFVSGEEMKEVSASQDGNRIAMFRSKDSTVSVMDTPVFPKPAPLWLADWAEAVGGMTLGEDGIPTAIPVEKRRAWRGAAKSHAGADAFGRALAWWLGESEERASSPYSALPVSEETKPRRFPFRDANATAAQVDLTDHYIHRLDEDPSAKDQNDTLQDLPHGLHEWNGITFDVRGCIQLAMGAGATDPYPGRKAGIRIGQKARALHLIGGVRNAKGDVGDEVLRLVVHYADGTKAEGSMRLGIDVGDWWPAILPAEDRLVWTGMSPASRQKGHEIGVYHMRWENPKTEVPIESMDLVSMNRTGAPFVLAITVEP